MAKVSMHNVVKRFGDTTVIPDLNLDIADGEFVVLVGPSGCGKTTSLRMIAGLELASAGQISIGERDVTNLMPGKRNCAMVFQNYALYPHMTVADNITYGLRVRGVPKEEIDGLLKEAARILGLEPYLDRRPKQLSGGQQQRVAIGRAIVRQPDVFLFDEPLSNLDAKLRVEMRTEIKQLHRRLGNTIVYVTHDQVEAMTLADRVVVMNHGVIEQVAPPIELYEKPANRFVAGFIGAPAMNFLPATMDSGNVILSSGETIPVVTPNGTDRTELLVGIRPEHVVGVDTGQGQITMNVMEIEPLGPHKLLIGEVSGERFVAQVDVHFPVEIDRQASLAVSTGQCHLFETTNGQALRH